MYIVIIDILITCTIENGKYHTIIFYKRDNFGFNIVNFQYLCSNIAIKPAYGVYMYISQLVRIGKICDSLKDFGDRHYKLTSHLIQQGFWYTKLHVHVLFYFEFSKPCIVADCYFAKPEWPVSYWIINSL